MTDFFKFLLTAVFTISIMGYQTFSQEVLTKQNLAKPAAKQYQKGLDCLKKKSYNKAEKVFDKLLSKHPNFIDGWIAKSRIASEMGNSDASLGFMKKAIELDPTYDARLLYSAGINAFRNDQFKDAEKYFSMYVQSPKKTSARTEAAAKYLELGRFREQAIQNPVPFDPKPLSANINSEYSEFLPGLTAENVMVFSRRINNQEDLFFSIKNGNVWSDPQPITNLNTPENEAAHSISADGQWLVFTICNREESMGSCDLMICERKGDVWSQPRNMGAPINTPGWESQPALSSEGDILIFASNRTGGFGDYDLWLSYKSNGRWSVPQNMGDKINTNGKDETPFLHADYATLYFSSDGHLGMGDSDIFISRKQDGQWSEPVNLGYPINTKNREGTMSVAIDGKQAYYASDRNSINSNNPNLDIFTFELPEHLRANPVTYVKVLLKDKITGNPLAGKVTITNMTNLGTKEVAVSDFGSRVIILNIAHDYGFLAEAAGYTINSEAIKFKHDGGIDNPLVFTINLEKLEEVVDVSEPVVLNNIFFETNSAQLLEESDPELFSLFKFLENNNTVKIEIHGHTDNTGTESYNEQLSLNRASAVYEKMIKFGIEESRMSYRGFGSSKPIASNETAEGRQKNRRTEFVVINE